MELLKNLTEAELTDLRAQFDSTAENALDRGEFETVISDACSAKGIDAASMGLDGLFNDIDINGDGTVSWEEFSDFTIKGATSGTAPAGHRDGAVKGYNKIYDLNTEVPGSVVRMQYIPEEQKVIKVIRRGRVNRLKVCLNNANFQMYQEANRFPNDASINDIEYIPFYGDVACSGVLCGAFTDAYLRFYECRRMDIDHPQRLLLRKEFAMQEFQTVLKWAPKYQRMITGARSGIVSVLDVDSENIVGQERIHSSLIGDMKLRGTQLFTAALDSEGSVKCTDLEQSVVRYALDGHKNGAYLVDLNPEYQQLYSVGYDLHALVYSLSTPKMAPYKLVDNNRPHHRRIVSLNVIPNTPQVVTTDVTGIMKVWDIRMYSCVQTIHTAKDDLGYEAGNCVSSICYIPVRSRLIVNGRETKVYQYDEPSFPENADDTPVSGGLFNPMSRSFLTVHNTALKLWDANTGAVRGEHRTVAMGDDDAVSITDDITSLCLATPLCRKMFVGTITGDLYSVGYAVCEIIRKFPDNISSAARGEREIVALKYVEGFKDNRNQNYVLVAYKREIVLVPDAEEHVQRANLPLRCYDAVLEHTTVKSVLLAATNQVLVGTANGAVHVADLTTFTLHHSITTNVAGDVLSLCELPVPHDGTSAASVCFFSDSSQIHALYVDTSSEAQAMHRWGKPVVPRESTLPALAGEPRSNRRRISLVRKSIQRSGSSSHIGDRPNSAVAGYFTASREAVFAPVVTSIVVIERYQMIVTGNEKGEIRMWDVSGLIARAQSFIAAIAASFRSSTMSSPTYNAAMSRGAAVLVRRWSAHESEIRMLAAVDADTDKIKLISAAGRDATTWSLDGAELGTLSQGRLPGEPLPPGVKPFRFDEAGAEDWEETATYLKERKSEQEELVRRSSGIRRDDSNTSLRSVSMTVGPAGGGLSSRMGSVVGMLTGETAPDGSLNPSIPEPLSYASLQQQESSTVETSFRGISAFLTDFGDSMAGSVSTSNPMLGEQSVRREDHQAALLSLPPRVDGLVDTNKLDLTTVKKHTVKAALKPLQPPKVGPPRNPQTPRGTQFRHSALQQVQDDAAHRAALTARKPKNPRSASAAAEALLYPPNRKGEFVAFDKDVVANLKSLNIDDNPMETQHQKQLRERGLTVLDSTAKEASSRSLKR